MTAAQPQKAEKGTSPQIYNFDFLTVMTVLTNPLIFYLSNNQMSKPKQSKEAEIRKKLAQSGITSPEEFQEIITNLINQRERLEADLKQLRQKVIALQERQAQKLLSKTMRKKGSPLKRQINYREELNKKYEQLKQWQKKSLKAMKNSPVQLQYRTYFDKLFSVQQEIQQTLRQLNDEYATNKKLKKALKIISKDQQINHDAHQGIQRENKLLKKRVFSLRKIVDRQLDKEMELHNYLIDIKQKQREFRAREREVASRQNRLSRELREVRKMKTEGITQRKSEELSDHSLDDVDIQVRPDQLTGKEEVYQIQGRLNRIQKKYREEVVKIQKRIMRNYPNDALRQRREGSKLTFNQEFQMIIDRVKLKLDRLNQLNRKKTQLFMMVVEGMDDMKSSRSSGDSSLIKGVHNKSNSRKRTTQLVLRTNESALSKMARNKSVVFQSQSKIIYPRILAAVNQQSAQTQANQYYDQELSILRRQLIGIMDQHSFFDRSLLANDSNCCIKKLQIYYTNRGISAIQATYTNNHPIKPSTIQGNLVIPDTFIKDYCKMHTIDTNQDDFIRYFKMRYHTIECRVTQIKIVTNRGLKNGWGDSKIKGQECVVDEEVEKEIVFDINQDEFPVSIFCSHRQKGPYWYLSGFGVEVNEL